MRTSHQGQRKPIDAALDQLLVEATPGVPMSQTFIAGRCQVAQATIAQYERRALIKIRKLVSHFVKELAQ